MNPSWTELLQAFASAHGLAVDAEAAVVEFDFQGLGVIIGPHPLHDDRLIAEVDVIEFDIEPEARHLALILQINEAARFEHDWTIVIDGDRRVLLYTTGRSGDMTPATLEQLISEGIDRALALQTLLDAAQESDPAAPGQDAPRADIASPQFIRG